MKRSTRKRETIRWNELETSFNGKRGCRKSLKSLTGVTNTFDDEFLKLRKKLVTKVVAIERV